MDRADILHFSPDRLAEVKCADLYGGVWIFLPQGIPDCCLKVHHKAGHDRRSRQKCAKPVAISQTMHGAPGTAHSSRRFKHVLRHYSFTSHLPLSHVCNKHNKNTLGLSATYTNHSYVQFSCSLVLLSLTASFQNALNRVRTILHNIAYSKSFTGVDRVAPTQTHSCGSLSLRRSQGSL